jgi:hypothetical protein
MALVVAEREEDTTDLRLAHVRLSMHFPNLSAWPRVAGQVSAAHG